MFYPNFTWQSSPALDRARRLWTPAQQSKPKPVKIISLCLHLITLSLFPKRTPVLIKRKRTTTTTGRHQLMSWFVFIGPLPLWILCWGTCLDLTRQNPGQQQCVTKARAPAAPFNLPQDEPTHCNLVVVYKFRCLSHPKTLHDESCASSKTWPGFPSFLAGVRVALRKKGRSFRFFIPCFAAQGTDHHTCAASGSFFPNV